MSTAQSTTEERHPEANIPLPDGVEGSHEDPDEELNEDTLPPHPEEPLAKSPQTADIAVPQSTAEVEEELEPSPSLAQVETIPEPVSPSPEAQTPSDHSEVEPQTSNATAKATSKDVELATEERISVGNTPPQVNGHVVQHSSSTDEAIQEQLRQLERRFAGREVFCSHLPPAHIDVALKRLQSLLRSYNWRRTPPTMLSAP